MRLGEVRGRDRALCVFYALFALVGLVAMGALAVAFVRRAIDDGADGAVGVIRHFLHDALTNLASQFIYADLVLIWLGLAAFMIVESRRLGIRYVWAYIVGAPALALCVSFAVFMYVRQLKIAAAGEEGRRPAAGATARGVMSGAGR
ncbi:DUF2834 domain-containing protein [Streptomyces roseifaciens]